MAHEQEIMRIDSKGRVTIPAHMREELGMKEGSYTAVRIDREDRSVAVSLFAGAHARLVEMKLKIPDRPGALARVARTLSEMNLDLMTSSSRTVKKGDLAEWVVVADVGQSGMTIEEIRRKILGNRDAMAVEVKELPI
ncbi:MAG: ACT domain-containing protein [Candidatus Verstraetearchaeota archaeon]|nr:ACT domain-containing protein [Candidatus Verstraetearchaeota archaeon]